MKISLQSSEQIIEGHIIEMVESQVADNLCNFMITLLTLFTTGHPSVSGAQWLTPLDWGVNTNALIWYEGMNYNKFVINVNCRPLTRTYTVLVTTIDAQWEGMGDVGSARYEPAPLPPFPTIRVLSYSN